VRTDIVVGVDVSRGSAAALAWALDDASRRGVRVRAVLAWADEDRPAEVDAAAASPRLEDLAAEANAVLHRLVITARSASAGGSGRPPGLEVPVDERAVYSTAPLISA
jgi:nucleotide-binding universal stress UspA family protein